jgi:hypothetical protein
LAEIVSVLQAGHLFSLKERVMLETAVSVADEYTPVENVIANNAVEETVASSAAGKSPVEEVINPTLLYDADAEQRCGFTVVKKDKRFKVYYTFGGIDDDVYVEYDRQRRVRMAADGQGGMDSKSNSVEAAAWLGRKILKFVEGWGASDGSNVKDRQLADAVQNSVLACAVDQTELELGDAETDRPWEDEDDESNTYALRAMFSGNELICKHALNDANAEQEKRWNRLMSQTKLTQGEKLSRRDIEIPSRARAIGKLYDEMMVSAEGYAGRVPLHHKVEIMQAHMGLTQELADEAGKD